MAIRVDSNGLYLEGRRLPLLSGSVNYWQHPADRWPDLLGKVKELGFEILQTTIPWGIHETGPGIFDFGEKKPSRNLPKFLGLCKELELFIIINPGPILNEDLPLGGFPLRMIKNPTIWALTSTGAPALSNRTLPPFPIPSYASEKFYYEIGRFFDKLVPVIKAYQYPDGPVVVCEVNKETEFFGRYQAYDLDYAPESISLYRQFLSDKYGTVEVLNEVYGKNFNAIAAVQPPRDFNAVVQRDLPWYLDWVEYKEFLIRQTNRRLAQMLRERGISVPLALDGPADIVSPIDTHALMGALESPLVGVTIDPRPQEYPVTARLIRYLAGTRKLPWVSDFGSGTNWSSAHIATPEEEEFAILSAVMHGMAGANFHMLVEGDRWVGAPITREGAFREEYAAIFRRLTEFFIKYNIWDSKKYCRTLVLLPWGLDRYRRAFSTLNYAYLGLLHIPAVFSEVKSTLGFQTEPARQSFQEEGNWLSEVFRFLENGQMEYNISDTHAPMDDLTKYDTIFLPTADFMDTREQDKLLEFADRGGHLVFGPGIPTLDGRMTPASVLGSRVQGPGTQAHGVGKITLLTSFDPETIKDLITADMPNVILQDNPNVRLTIREGNAMLVFLANPTSSQQRSMLIASWPMRGVLNAPEETQSGSVTTELGPYSVQVWEVLK
jgi:beta-galactosidase